MSNISFIFGIAAGKGGVGKSTLTTLLATSLKRRGLRVGIFDADIYGPSIPLMLGVDSPPRSEQGFVVPAIGNGIPYFSFAFMKEGPAAVRAPIANQVIKQAAKEIAWGELDVLLIDFPPGTGDIHLTAMQELLLSGMLYVSTSRMVALSDVQKAFELGESMGIPTLGFVENMGNIGKVDALAKKLDAPYLGAIEHNPLIADALDQGVLWEGDEVEGVTDAVLQAMNSDKGAFECDLTWNEAYATERS